VAQDTLLQKLDEAAGRAKQLVKENNEATARIQPLEREASELRSIISLAVSKVDEMLKGESVSPA